eukprot:752218-Hanusia_phi.AAC.6
MDEDNAVDKLAEDSNLPSWLRTGPVKLVPLDKLVRQQMVVKGLSQGRIKDSDSSNGDDDSDSFSSTPHDMAMKNALHMQAVRKREAHHHHVAGATHSSEHVHMAHEQHKLEVETDDSNDSSLKKEISKASSLAAGVGAAEESALKSLHVQGGDSSTKSDQQKAPIPHLSLDAELAEKKKELSEVKSTEVKEINIIQKAELHKLAAIKKTDLGKELDLKKQIKDLEARSALRQQEKKIQEQISHVKEEEERKLSALHKNLAALQGTEVHEHKLVSKPIVKVVQESKPRAKETDASTASHETVKAPAAKPAPKTDKATQKEAKSACTTSDCAVDGEDKKWLVKKGSVSKYSRLAVDGSGKAKREAIEHMQKLKEQIEDDYKHVTDFAIAQENALSPPPNQH